MRNTRLPQHLHHLSLWHKLHQLLLFAAEIPTSDPKLPMLPLLCEQLSELAATSLSSPLPLPPPPHLPP
jgi:hypothetical protein